MIDDTRDLIDVSITATPRPALRVNWPNSLDIAIAIAADRANAAQRSSTRRWEDSCEVGVYQEVTVSRKFNQLAADKVILPQLLLKGSDKSNFVYIALSSYNMTAYDQVD